MLVQLRRLSYVSCPEVNLLRSRRCTRFNSFTSLGRLKKCPFCGGLSPLSMHQCTSCAAPASIPEDVSFYDIFPTFSAAPPKGPFTIDTRALRKHVLQAQQKVHPDNFSSDEKKRLIAESTSGLLNKVYSTLLDPLSRAEYLLGLQNIEVSSEGDKLTDPDILMTVMDAREEIEEAKTENDLQNIRSASQTWIQNEITNLEEAFAKADYQAAKESAVKLRYWQNIQKAARDWEPGQAIKLAH